MKDAKKVLIVGGGISGLTSAFYLQEFSRKNQIPLEITLLEAGPRLGGIIQTQEEKGFLLEEGPDAFLSEKKAILDLCNNLGLEKELISTEEKKRRSFILRRKKLYPVPKGFYLMTPVSWKALWTLPQISFLGKFRMALEPFISVSLSEDESVASFAYRRFGREAYEKLIEPMLSGIYSGDLSKISLEASFPKFKVLEKKYGSIIRGYKKENSRPLQEASGPRYSLFLSFKKGMSELIRVLAEKLGGLQIHCSHPVSQIEKGSLWNVYTSQKERFQADAVCLTVPAYQASELLKPIDFELSQVLSQIKYEPMIVINLAYDQLIISDAHKGFGFVVPNAENSYVMGCSFSSLKFADRAPENQTLLRVFVGRKGFQEFNSNDDSVLVETISKEINSILGISVKPIFFTINRYEKALPQYELGHLARVSEIESRVQKIPGLYITGNAFRGVGIPDTVSEAKKTAEEIIKSFNYVEV